MLLWHHSYCLKSAGLTIFFVPEMTAQKIFLDKYKGNKSAEEFVKYEKHGAELYHKYKEYYGYVFYIGKKI